MGKNSFYLGEVGNSSKMNLVLQVIYYKKNQMVCITSVQTIMGVTLAGLAEGMALADRAGLQQKDVMEVNELALDVKHNSLLGIGADGPRVSDHPGKGKSNH